MNTRSGIYGLTHTPQGQSITKQVRMLKVGFGTPSGKAILCFIDQHGKWIVRVGIPTKTTKAREIACKDKEEAKVIFKREYAVAPDRQYPSKLGFFTFLRIGTDGSYMPDFDAIERHGPVPTRILVVFADDNPLQMSMQWWQKSGLQCEGNGMDADRLVQLAKTEQEKQAAEASKEMGLRTFPISRGCRMFGCPYAMGDKPECKPHSRLHFQLAYSPTIGGTCFYDSTGFESASNLWSCLQSIRRITGRGEVNERGEYVGPIAGLPLELIVRPYKTSKGPQFSVALEMRAADLIDLHRGAIRKAEEFASIAGPARMIEAPEPLSEEVEATVMTREFYSDPTMEHDAESFDDPPEEASEEPQHFKKPQRKSDPSTPPTPSEVDELPAIVEQFKAANTEQRIAAFGQLALRMREVSGDDFECSRILGKHGVAHAREFKSLPVALMCFEELWKTCESIQAALKDQ